MRNESFYAPSAVVRTTNDLITLDRSEIGILRANFDFDSASDATPRTASISPQRVLARAFASETARHCMQVLFAASDFHKTHTFDISDTYNKSPLYIIKIADSRCVGHLILDLPGMHSMEAVDTINKMNLKLKTFSIRRPALPENFVRGILADHLTEKISVRIREDYSHPIGANWRTDALRSLELDARGGTVHSSVLTSSPNLNRATIHAREIEFWAEAGSVSAAHPLSLSLIGIDNAYGAILDLAKIGFLRNLKSLYLDSNASFDVLLKTLRVVDSHCVGLSHLGFGDCRSNVDSSFWAEYIKASKSPEMLRGIGMEHWSLDKNFDFSVFDPMLNLKHICVDVDGDTPSTDVVQSMNERGIAVGVHRYPEPQWTALRAHRPLTHSSELLALTRSWRQI